MGDRNRVLYGQARLEIWFQRVLIPVGKKTVYLYWSTDLLFLGHLSLLHIPVPISL